MDLLISRYRNLTVLLIAIISQLLLLAYQVKSNQDVRLIRVWSVTAVTPLAKVLEVVRRNTIGVVEDYFVLINVREQNRRLNEENGRLKLENQFLKTELQTADRARALAAFQSRSPSRTIPARIVGTGTGANAKVVFVDQGSRAGVMRGMAVVTPDGIVGKVLASYPTASQVLLITDPTFAAGVISDKNRIPGTLKGIGQSKCIVQYVQNEEKVEVGETFYTSGDDRVFPKGLPVGKVTVVREGKTFKEIFVVPAGFQQGMEEVLIVLEGVHQSVPEAKAVSSPGYSILPAPVDTRKAPPNPPQSVLQTDADRIRDRYKRIGEAQKHVFGEGEPGSKPPDFNLNPDAAAKPQASSTPPAQPRPVSPENAEANTGTSRSASAAGSTAGASQTPPTKPKPTVTGEQTSPANSPTTGGQPAAPKPKPAAPPARVNPPVTEPDDTAKPKPTPSQSESRPSTPTPR
jgi:rod shape-determining protein MreC